MRMQSRRDDSGKATYEVCVWGGRGAVRGLVWFQGNGWDA